MRSQQSVASPSRRLAADPKRRGLFAPVVSGQDAFGHSGHQIGSQKTAGAFHGCWRFGFRYRWRHHAPLGGSFERRGTLGRLGFDGSFGRPSNTQMEPSRQTVLCDPVTAARGSFATLGC